MIQRLSLYMFRQTFIAFAFAVMAVTFVVLFTQSFRMLSFVINNSSTALIFFKLMGLMIPTFLPLIVPLGLGISILFIYHKFAVDSELVVMRVAGIGPLKLAKPALVLAALVTLFCYGLTIWVTPASNRELVSLQYKVRDDFSVFLMRPGTFNDISNGLTFYARRRGKDGALQDILIHDIRKPKKPVTIIAESGQVTLETKPPQIIVFKGKKQEVDRETGHMSQLEFDRYVLDLQPVQNGSSKRVPDPREQSMAELFSASMAADQKKVNSDRIRAEIHQRLSSPLLALTYTFLGLAAILAGEFSRRGMARRILGAAVAIIAVQALTLSLISLVGKNPWFIPVLYGVILGPIPLCLSVLNSAEKWAGFFRFRKTPQTPTVTS